MKLERHKYSKKNFFEKDTKISKEILKKRKKKKFVYFSIS
jgi:hypothetical protein